MMLSSQGYVHSDIDKIVEITHPVISSDIHYLKELATENILGNTITRKLPFEYKKSMHF
jgi:hypothetical protein